MSIDLLDELDQDMADRLAGEIAEAIHRLSGVFRTEIVEHAVARAASQVIRYRAGPSQASAAVARVTGHLFEEMDVAA